MTTIKDLESLLQGLPRTMVHPTKEPHVYTLKRARKDRRETSDSPRRRFIAQLRTHLPAGLLWLNELQEDVAASLGDPVGKSGDTGFWSVPDDPPFDRLLDHLHVGAWALFFYAAAPEPTPDVPSPLLTESGDVTALLEKTQASAAILSWYDDVEWLVAFRP